MQANDEHKGCFVVVAMPSLSGFRRREVEGKLVSVSGAVSRVHHHEGGAMSPTGKFKGGLAVPGAGTLDGRIEMRHGDRCSRYLVDKQAYAGAAKHGVARV